jgi:spermidine/putrescine transport system substrate-binding protein
MCIPKGAANKKNAELFINYMTATDSALKNMDAIGYISANAAAAEAYGAELEPEDYAVQFPSDEVLARCEPFYNLPPDTLKLYDEFWGELRK